jgi:hypothetical protein
MYTAQEDLHEERNEREACCEIAATVGAFLALGAALLAFF